MKGRRVMVICVLATLGACSLAPAYQRPPAPVPAAPVPGVAVDRNPADFAWSQLVVEARLRQVIALALDNSRDLRSALNDVEAARAQYRVSRAAQVPAVDASLGGSKAKALGSEGAQISESWSTELRQSAFELDLFGKLRNQSRSALENYLATAQGAHAVRIAVIAETATAWVALAADRSRLQLAEQTRRSAGETVAVVQRRLEFGVDGLLELRQAQTTLYSAESNIAALRAVVAQDINALRLLVGAEIEAELLPAQLSDDADRWLTALPAELPSTVLLQRPDVLQAEHLLIAAHADIGVARAAYFPSLSLTAASGFASDSLSGLFDDATGIWSFSPSLNLPIFSGGALRAGVDYANAQQQSALAQYELSIQTAFRELADALADAGVMEDRLQAQQRLLVSAADSLQLAMRRYQSGVDSYLNVMDAQRSVYSAQDALQTLRATALQNRITLYRVAGGGTATAAGGEVAARR